MGGSANTPPAETQLQHRPHLAHRDAANAATEKVAMNTQLKTLSRTGSSRNKTQHAISCEYSRLNVDDRQLMISHAAGVHTELRDQFLATRNGKPRWSTTAFACTVHEIEHHDEVSSVIFADEFGNENPREWTNQTLTTLEDAMEA